MNIAEFSVKRPITVLMVIMAVFLLGFVSLSRLKIDLLPDITLPVVTVTTLYPGAGPEEVESFVTKPIEEAAGLVKNLDEISSYSMEGVSSVMVRFKWGTDIDYGAMELKEKIDPVIDQLPSEAHRPVITKIDISAMIPVVGIALTGADLQTLRDLADNVVKKDLERVTGVAMATPMGGLEREIRVEVNPSRLKAYGLAIEQVVQAISAENRNLPTGYLRGPHNEYLVRAVGEVRNPQELGDITLTIKNGAPILLKDVAVIKDTTKEPTSYARVNGKPAVTVMVYKQSGTNTVDVSERVQKAMKDIQKELPPGVSMQLVMDQADYIKKSIKNLEDVALEGAFLAVLIIFFFLTTLRGTFVIALSIPISLFVAFIYMFFSGTTMNIVTMGGLVIAIGRIIDDSIVALENIYRHIERGEAPKTAAVEALKEIGMPIVASTLTTIAAFFPILFITGITQQMFSAMVLVFSVALLTSMFVAFFVVPMLSSRILRPLEEEKRKKNILDKLVDGFQAGYRVVEELYKGMLRWVLRHRIATIGIGIASFVISLFLVPIIGLEYIPALTNTITLTVKTPVGTRLEETDRVISEAEKYFAQVPEFEVYTAYCGGGGGRGPGGAAAAMAMGGVNPAQSGRIMGRLKPMRELKRSVEEIKDWLRERIYKIPKAKFSFMEMTSILTGGRGGMADIDVEIRGDDLPTLANLANELAKRMKKIPGVYDVDLSWTAGAPEYQVIIDREKARTFGITAGQIGSALYTLLGGQQVTKYREKGKEYDITVQAPASLREWENTLRKMPLYSPVTKSTIPLEMVAQVVLTTGPSLITRRQLTRTIDVTAAKGNRALSDIVRDIQRELVMMNLPAGYTTTIRGTEESRREAFSGLFIALVAAIFLIYIILASQFESLVQPLVVMTAIPMALIGVMLGLLLGGQTISVLSMLGILMLVGIVISNSVLLVQFINLQRERGLETNDAILVAGPIRLRPILMTALGTIFAMIPMALAIREGSEMFKPLAIAVLGGLTTSTFLTLLFVPAIYSILDEWARRRRQKKID
ncbi:efflux RND transporter permease subunit [bacterium]|nr:efflux RND transporter permease subunit [bacterium]